jgi:hypothetical protein
MAACPVRFYNSVMKKLLWVLCGSLVLLLAPLFGEPHEWTNAQGKTIKAEFVSATNESVTISMQGKDLRGETGRPESAVPRIGGEAQSPKVNCAGERGTGRSRSVVSRHFHHFSIIVAQALTETDGFRAWPSISKVSKPGDHLTLTHPRSSW